MKSRYFFSFLTGAELLFLVLIVSVSFAQEPENSHLREEPIIICPDDIWQVTDPDQCMAYITVPIPEVISSCGEYEVWNDYNYTSDASGVYPVGIIIVWWYAMDIYGNTDSCSMNVIVIDDTPPEITCPADTVIGCPDDYFEPDPQLVIASDNCMVDNTWIVDETYEGLGSQLGWCPSSILRTYQTDDIFGNSATCTQIITIDDPCGCSYCTSNIPHFFINLSNNPDSIWMFPPISREGFCCDAQWPERCIAFSVMLGEEAVGFFFTYEGANPSSEEYIMVNCMDNYLVGDTIPLEAYTYLTFTFCKQGDEATIYYVGSVSESSSHVYELDNTTNIHFEIYPNPSTGEVTISYVSKSASEVTLHIMDLTGNEILSKSLPVNPQSKSNHYKVSDLPEGIYMVGISTRESSMVKKLVVL